MLARVPILFVFVCCLFVCECVCTNTSEDLNVCVRARVHNSGQTVSATSTPVPANSPTEVQIPVCASLCESVCGFVCVRVYERARVRVLKVHEGFVPALCCMLCPFVPPFIRLSFFLSSVTFHLSVCLFEFVTVHLIRRTPTLNRCLRTVVMRAWYQLSCSSVLIQLTALRFNLFRMSQVCSTSHYQ